MTRSKGLFGRDTVPGRARPVAIALCGVLLGGGLIMGLPTAALAQGLNPQWEKTGTDFHPDGVWRVKGRRIRETRQGLLRQGNFGALNHRLRGSPSTSTATAMAGTLDVPVLTFYFQDSNTDNLFSVFDYYTLLFSQTPPLGRPYTLRTFYESMSDGVFSMNGQITGWFGLPNPEASYTGTNNGLGPSMKVGLVEVLRQADAFVDYSQFDNDGADGVPNSGDDDGYIDLVLFLQPEIDGSCGNNNHAWAHKHELAFTTKDQSAPGGQIKARDYLLQSAVGGSTVCTAGEIMPIGVVAHELGHGLDLPDLYDTDQETEGIGNWGLMGTGPYVNPHSPARMEAWSLSEMGWVSVVPLASGSFSLGAAPVSDTAFLVTPPDANPRGESFLLENRQAVQADTALIRVQGGGGLLIWHVDQQRVASDERSQENRVNAGPIHGVDLIQADDEADLRRGENRGDGGDPYPGLSANTEFSASSHPAAQLNSATNGDGAPAGFSLTAIRQVVPNGAMSFTLGFGGGGGGEVTILSEGTRPEGIMGHVYNDMLEASGGTGSFLWALTAGALPAALTLEPNGAISGELQELGEFNFTASASQGALVGTGAFTMTVSAPDLATGTVVSHLIDRTGGIGSEDLHYLDLLGNRNSLFDLGDFLAWVNSTGAQGAATRPSYSVPARGRQSNETD